MSEYETEEPRPLSWLATLAPACFAVFILSYFVARHSNNVVLTMAACTIATAIMIAGFYFAIGRRLPAAKLVPSLLLMVAIMVATAGVTHQRYRQEMRVATDSLSKQLADIEKTIGTDDELKPRPTVDTTPTTTGAAGQLELFAKTHLNRNIELNNRYLAELAANGWNGFLDAARLKKDTDLSESRIIVARSKATIKKFAGNARELLDVARADIDKLDLTSVEKAQFADGFERGVKSSEKMLDAIWELELRIVEQAEESVEFLGAHPKAWIVEADQIVFLNDEDAANFNAYMSGIQKTVAEQEALRRKLHSDAQRSLKTQGR